MPRFPSALLTALSEAGLSQVDFAEKSGVSLSSLNKYCRGHAKVGPDVIERIASALPPEQRANLIVAYLEDVMPEAGEDLVKISAATARSAKLPEPFFQVPAPVREALSNLAIAAREDPRIGDLLVLLSDSLVRRGD